MTKRKIYLRAGKIIAIFTFFCLLFNQSTRDFILFRQGAFVPKMTFAFFAVFFVDVFSEKIRYGRKILTERKFVGHKIDGIPSKKLLHIITTTNGLSYDNFTKNISSDKEVYRKLGDNLERAGILTRGNKNARILNNSFSTNQIYKILTSTTNSDTLPHGLLQVRDGSYTFINQAS